MGDDEEDGAQSEDIENDEADTAATADSNTETASDATPVTNEAAAKTDAEESQPSTSANANNTKDQESAVRLWFSAVVASLMIVCRAFSALMLLVG